MVFTVTPHVTDPQWDITDAVIKVPYVVSPELKCSFIVQSCFTCTKNMRDYLAPSLY